LHWVSEWAGARMKGQRRQAYQQAGVYKRLQAGHSRQVASAPRHKSPAKEETNIESASREAAGGSSAFCREVCCGRLTGALPKGGLRKQAKGTRKGECQGTVLSRLGQNS
jgi:hypothetical protein